ncbi:helix-turn-helix transcriptional regulator [Niabella drilacis]|uniref:Predicted DNA-binding transcriptional regulator YafY, contains an HTH and WYL domains n=1 Tax=Niabella drilacis (strain DSM 25811 / CCM 8410 / CCUG 62505 / LMG 26954 / E90) TaxID=1285928 RepID=A0A1G6T056_NIADE|nr:YafY family protein [Niabella drilacis]SDD21886.1 Predicted DNA-binding transcriptional regulator YafY, contains an HTH and WYL domains [Niabella drilacis]
MSFESMNKFDRIVAILIQLQSRRVVKAQDLADRFRVSLRTIYRDIRSLQTAGVPIASEAGIGYELVEGYRLPPVMFTREEASSFVAAEKLMQKFIDKRLGDHFASAIAKMKAVLRMADKDWISSIEEQVLVRQGQRIFNEKVPEAMSVLFDSLARKEQVEVRYKKLESGEPELRRIEPVGVFHEHEFWYLMAYCHLRKDYRRFRTDRIQGIKRTEIPFVKEHPELKDFLTQPQEGPRTKVRIVIDPKIARHLEWNKKYHGFTEEKTTAAGIEMTFMSRYPESDFARWFMSFGDYARILEPASLKECVRSIVAKQMKNLEER